ncbi:MAG: alpha/beta hydrolase family protein [Ramlibacter sp.]
MFTYLLLISSFAAHAEFTLLTEGEYDGHEEEEIVTKVPWRSFLSTRDVEISGTLRYPKLKDGAELRKFPVIVYNHGGHTKRKEGNSRTSQELMVSLLVRKGFAVLTPARKGFANSGVRRNTLEADVTEPISCDASESEQGLKSAITDVSAFLAAIAKNDKLDARRIVMSGHSRGGFLSLAYAAAHPGSVMGVVSFVPGWHSETCPTSYNYIKLSEFASRISSPTYIFYANRDWFYNESHVKNFVQMFSSNKEVAAIVVEGGHDVPRGEIGLWESSLEAIFKGKQR